MEPAGPAVQHRPFGIVCIKGPDIRQDERIYGATLLDVTPTILTLFGLPVADDMDGRVLVQAFESPPVISRIPSWEQEAGSSGMHPPDLRIDPASAQAVLDRFVALGYIEPPSDDQRKATERAIREQNYNLARVYLDARRYADALPLLEELAKKNPDQPRFAQHLAQCYMGLERRADARILLERLLNYQPAAPAKDRQEPSESTSPGNQDAALEPKPRPWADLLMGILRFQEGDLDGALRCMLIAEQFDPRLPDLHLRIGETYLRQRRTGDAERAFHRALEIDGDSAEGHLGQAVVYLRQRRNREAAEQALVAVGLQHFLPMGHFHLGVALARLGHRERSILAFETALSMLPGLLPAHRWLSALQMQPGGDLERAARHREVFLELRQRREIKMHA
jgi:tetratricopeptide (TPR) repeat protein